MANHTLGQTWLPICNGSRRDQRYKVSLELCGYELPRYVVRYCDVWKGSYATLQGATEAAMDLRQRHEQGIREMAA